MSEIEDKMTAVTSATDNSYEKLVTELRNDLENLEPPLSRECCIYRVPSNLRRVNEAAYTPQFVSIGPLHYGDENLKKMEKHKLRYLERFLTRAEGIGKRLEDFVGYVKENEERVRRCYAETFDHLNSYTFARMILVDAAFIVEHILRSNRTWLPGEGNELLFDNSFLRIVLRYDLVLLENQLPFFALEELLGMLYEDPSCSEIFRHFFFTDLNSQKKPTPPDVKHFTDLVRTYQLTAVGEEMKEQKHTRCSCFSNFSSRLSKVLERALRALITVGFHVLSLLLCLKPREDKRTYDERNLCLYSASELNEAGVRFKVRPSQCLLDIKFTNESVLEMPCFIIDDGTEASVRNVMALEQCHYPEKSIVCDYFVLMGCLVKSDKDVDLLVRKKILVNEIGNNHQIACLVNKLVSEIVHYPEVSHYSQTIMMLNAYLEVPYRQWIATLNHIHNRAAWKIPSTIAASIVLLLTVVQTICSILSLLHSS